MVNIIFCSTFFILFLKNVQNQEIINEFRSELYLAESKIDIIVNKFSDGNLKRHKSILLLTNTIRKLTEDVNELNLTTLEDIKIFHEYDSIYESLENVSLAFNNFDEIIKQSNIDEYYYINLVSFSDVIIMQSEKNIVKALWRIEAAVDGGIFQELQTKLLERRCDLHLSVHQILYDFYKIVSVIEFKGYLLVEMTYTILELYKFIPKSNFTYLRKKYNERSITNKNEFKMVSVDENLSLSKCLPKNLIKGVTYVELSGRFNRSNNGNSTEACPEYEDTFVSLQSVEADKTKNMVAVGLRIIKQDSVIYLQLQQGKLLPYGEIDQQSLQWIPVKPINITNNSTSSLYHTLDQKSCNIVLGDQKVNGTKLIIGVQLQLDSNNSLRLKISTSDFNFKDGLLLYITNHTTKPSEFLNWKGISEEISFNSSNPLRRNQIDFATKVDKKQKSVRRMRRQSGNKNATEKSIYPPNSVYIFINGYGGPSNKTESLSADASELAGEEDSSDEGDFNSNFISDRKRKKRNVPQSANFPQMAPNDSNKINKNRNLLKLLNLITNHLDLAACSNFLNQNSNSNLTTRFFEEIKLEEVKSIIFPNFIDVQAVEMKIARPLIGIGIYYKEIRNFGGFLAPKIITYNFNSAFNGNLLK